jgi:hypothetical protein
MARGDVIRFRPTVAYRILRASLASAILFVYLCNFVGSEIVRDGQRRFPFGSWALYAPLTYSHGYWVLTIDPPEVDRAIRHASHLAVGLMHTRLAGLMVDDPARACALLRRLLRDNGMAVDPASVALQLNRAQAENGAYFVREEQSRQIRPCA